MVKISQLPLDSSPGTGGLLPQVTSGQTRRSLFSALITLFFNNIPADTVNDAALDYPRWWQEIGRTTLVATGDSISVTGLPARKYLMILFLTLNSGQLISALRFNNDSGNNYSYRLSSNGGADSTTTSTSNIIAQGASSYPSHGSLSVINIAGQEKAAWGQIIGVNTAGAANVSGKTEIVGKWANTTDAISRIDMVNTGTGDFAAGSELVILGHD